MSRLSPAALAALAVGMLGFVAWVALAFGGLQAAVQGWWLGFLVISPCAFGAVALTLIERLTGGRWGGAFAPELLPAARLAPLAAAFAVPVAFALPLVFPWARAPQAIDSSVRGVYLNPLAFLVRQAILLGGWSAIGVWLPTVTRTRLRAGLALALHGLAVSLCAVDWTLSLHPLFTNSAQGMMLGVTQLASALAWAALQGAARPARAPAGDLGGLLFTTLLGLAYLGFMSYLVGWYGDPPATNTYWLPRAEAWAPLVQAALLFGLLVPAGLLALHKAVGMRAALRWAGASGMFGVALFTLWQTAPSLGFACVAPTIAAAAAQGGVWACAALFLAAPALRSMEAAA